jgi:hypothetical protein
MDNIGVFDRDQPLPGGGELVQSDGTSWMARFAITMLSIALELARHDAFYQNMATKYFEHFLYIAHAMTNMAGAGIHLWDDEDRFFFTVVQLPTGQNIPLRIFSMVGLVPLFAVLAPPASLTADLEDFEKRMNWFLEHRPDLARNVAPWNIQGQSQTGLLAILDGDGLAAVLRRVLDPDEFLSEYGVRALSRYHLEHPYVFNAGGHDLTVKYLPAESDNRLFGGNSNWRGPIWFPMNYLLIRALREYHLYYGNNLKVECPTGSGRRCNLGEVAADLAGRLANIFLRDSTRGGRRAVWGDNNYFQSDPHWRDYIPFYEYFHGDNGSGVGASHQTGWTALVAALLFDYGGQHDSA